MELYGNVSGNSETSIITPNGLITADVPVSPTSVYQFKMFNNGTGIEVIPENGTIPSLGLMLDVETPAYAQIVNANLSQIEIGGNVNLSNANGTITSQNSGLPRTCNLSLQQVTSNQNTSINITNVAIEGNSTLNINPSNWNDIGNSTVTIEDVGSNGIIYYTEIITYKNSQVTQVIFPSAALTMVKSAYPTSYDNVGQTITYTYTVTNTGNVDIKGPITVTDDKFSTITIPNSDTLSKGSSVIGTTTYKITDADIDAGSVSNLATATGVVNGNNVTSNNAVGVVLYEHPENHKEHPNNERDFGPNYGDAIVPPMMYGSPMYGNPMFSSEPSNTIKTPNSNSNGHKAKSNLSKHKHKHHTTKHHKTGKKNT